MGWIPMNENFQWLAGLPTLITTGIATVVEILAITFRTLTIY